LKRSFAPSAVGFFVYEMFKAKGIIDMNLVIQPTSILSNNATKQKQCCEVNQLLDWRLTVHSSDELDLDLW